MIPAALVICDATWIVPPARGQMLITTDLNDIKERLSIGVVTLVAARAGCMLTEINVDRQSVDVTMRPVKGQPVLIDAQLKSSSVLARQDGHLLVNLPIKNYNDLREEVVGIARILVVLDLDPDAARWVAIDAETLITRRLAYWMDLYGADASENTTRKRVKVPMNQPFTPESLREIMQRRYQNILANAGGVS